jgi:hypothetical protein
MCYITVVKKLKTKWFTKWARKNDIADKYLNEAVQNIESELPVVNLVAHIFKVRISRKGSGKSGGFRTILVFKESERAVFLYGFAKNEQDNISKTELAMFKKLGRDLLLLNQQELETAIKSNALQEIEE